MSISKRITRRAQRKAIIEDMGSMRQAKKYLSSEGVPNLSLNTINDLMNSKENTIEVKTDEESNKSIEVVENTNDPAQQT